MKKVLFLATILALAASPLFAQFTAAPDDPFPGYYVAYFANNPGPGGAADQQIRFINFGLRGTPLTSPVGDICAATYVFDANQEMVACCACRITPNGLLTLSVANGLTSNPVTSVVPVNGAIKVLAYTPNGTTCSPTAPNGLNVINGLVGFSTHLQSSGGTAAGTFITETEVPNPPLSADEGSFLLQSCQFAQYLGSGKGTCSCK